MIKEFKDNIKSALIKARLKRALRPDDAFLRIARERFLAQLTPRVVSTGVPVYARGLRYGMVAFLVVVSMTGGLAVLADKNDVSATNLLYPLKRMSEQTRLSVSPKKADLHAEFAVRRLNELKNVALPVNLERVGTKIKEPTAAQGTSLVIKASASFTPKVTPDRSSLVKKLNQEVRQELEQATEPSQDSRDEKREQQPRQLKKDRKERLCNALDEAINNKVIELRRGENLRERCQD